ncbi:hypothetical protein ABEB36_000051 [Hypothenemus hampei]|uniref:Ig-like domain-containing protein n=1 Tax=Hypothenemus hampei TaxID=57062 RepID=A0ABD1FA39_HYPHA
MIILLLRHLKSLNLLYTLTCILNIMEGDYFKVFKKYRTVIFVINDPEVMLQEPQDLHAIKSGLTVVLKCHLEASGEVHVEWFRYYYSLLLCRKKRENKHNREGDQELITLYLQILSTSFANFGMEDEFSDCFNRD